MNNNGNGKQLDWTQDQDLLDRATEAVKRGERCRVLYDIILSEIGMDYENSYGYDVFKKLQEVQEEYEEAVKMLSLTIKAHAMTRQKDEYGFPKDENYIENILKKDMGVS